MNDEQRAAIRDNAKYLRQVRPIDPEEIHEYVDGQPHPAAVRQVLREEATDLGLLERDDGRFEPVDEGSIDLTFHGVDALSESIVRRIEDRLVERYGPGWPDGESGDDLRAVIRDFKRRYLRGEVVTYDETTALGYAIYHLPPYFAAVQYVLADLAADNLLPRKLRVLDVGAGVGGPALGIDALLPDDALVEYHAVEPSDASDLLDDLLDATGCNVHPEIHREPVEAFDPDGPYDLILCANVLSELGDPVGVVADLLDVLADDGSVVALAPADRNTAIGLRRIEREIEAQRDVTVYGPTVRLWPGHRPGTDSWSFDRKPPLAAPAFQRRLDEGERGERPPDGVDEQTRREDAGARQPGDGEFVNVDVQYAYSVLRTDGEQAVRFRPDPEREAKMAEMERHITERIDCVGVKLSPNLADGGNPLFLVGDGSQRRDHFAVLTEPSAFNRSLEAADYGALLGFENVLVLWNDDEGAYNLVVGGETVVDRIPV
jgi:SAM-dependent methyltransferase